jgi:hypothetical protein
VKKDNFFGRASQIELLHKRVSSLKDGYRQNIAILGNEMVGKTSLIRRFLDRYSDPRTLILYLEARPEALEAFIRRFIASLLYNFLAGALLPLREDMDYLIKKSCGYLPRTSAKIRQLLSSLSRHKKTNLFGELLSLCELLHEETGKHCVVIFDEFLKLEQPLGRAGLYKEWARFILANKHTMFILSSSAKFKARLVFSRDLSLLFGNFEVINLEPFDIKISSAFFIQRLSGQPYNLALKDFFIHFTGGMPFYLDLVSRQLALDPNLAPADILEELLFSSAGVLHQRFSVYLQSFLDSSVDSGHILALQSISQGHNKLSDIIQLSGRSRKEILSCLNSLLEHDVINRSGDFFKLNDRVFAFWLRFVYQQRLSSLTLDDVNRRLAFRAQVEEMFKEFVTYSGRPIMERTAELLRYFEDGAMQFQEKRLRLDRFREIKAIEFRGFREAILGRSSESLWIFAFKDDRLNEEDILEFSRECRKYRSRLQRRIIITTQDIDANTRLRAMEEKVWAWDLDSLNNLFDLFSKPRVIR